MLRKRTLCGGHVTYLISKMIGESRAKVMIVVSTQRPDVGKDPSANRAALVRVVCQDEGRTECKGSNNPSKGYIISDLLDFFLHWYTMFVVTLHVSCHDHAVTAMQLDADLRLITLLSDVEISRCTK